MRDFTLMKRGARYGLPVAVAPERIAAANRPVAKCQTWKIIS
jgi:hypothetical protein